MTEALEDGDESFGGESDKDEENDEPTYRELLSSTSNLAEENRQLRARLDMRSKLTLASGCLSGVVCLSLLAGSVLLAESHRHAHERISKIAEFEKWHSQNSANLEARVVDLEKAAIGTLSKIRGTTFSMRHPSVPELERMNEFFEKATSDGVDEKPGSNNLDIIVKYAGINSANFGGKGFWLTPEGHFATAYHVLLPGLVDKLWQRSFESQRWGSVPAKTIINDSKGRTYELEDFLAIDPLSDIVIAKVKTEKLIEIQPTRLTSALDGSSVEIYGPEKREGKVTETEGTFFRSTAKTERGYSGSPIYVNGRLAGIVVRGTDDTSDGAKSKDLLLLIKRYCEYWKR